MGLVFQLETLTHCDRFAQKENRYFFKQASLDELLDLANHAWQRAQWANGLRIVLDNLEALLENAATPDVSTPPHATDF